MLRTCLRSAKYLVLLPLLLIAACAPKPAPDAAPPTPSAKPEAKADAKATGDIKIAVVPKAVTHQFWTTVKAGAEAAAKEGGASIIWKGPDKETDVSGQRAIIEDFVTNKVSAIVMAACDAKALVPTIEKAEAAGVPVITIDSGVDWDKVRSLVATDNVAGAKQGGEKLIELMGGSGEVGCIPFVKGAASSEDREKGFKQAVEATGGKVKVVSTLYSDSKIETAAKVTDDMLTASPGIKGIFAANEPGVVGAAQAVKAAGKAGKVIIVGFDGAPAEVEQLKAGVVSALVLQDPFKMGLEGVKQALAAIKGGTVEKRVDTGVFIMTKDNINTPEAQKLLMK